MIYRARLRRRVIQSLLRFFSAGPLASLVALGCGAKVVVDDSSNSGTSMDTSTSTLPVDCGPSVPPGSGLVAPCMNPPESGECPTPDDPAARDLIMHNSGLCVAQVLCQYELPQSSDCCYVVTVDPTGACF
jgi:hypothetical protein